ncbi:3-hydroxyacyl-[acyl-carrier-protein] dehydratase FabZ [Rubripirellula amarantea]|uniref:3-hydroxyacyl-[acyl-carrier-protein] dehydratase FabZ n=2 Tax=Rubripirellula amarantea TaxID=2527999 RepID=A0A5C5WHV2_9BACT|nr:3-hydroxyacyl-[acyl-carrier-protein] dehydratase FabZ [Rubripirellula amarantea]
MLLVDEIVSETDSSIVCRKSFSADEFFFHGHFPDSPIVPGVIQCECCLQAGAVLLSKASESASSTALPVATRMDSVKFKKMVRPGDTAEIEVTLNEQVSNAYYLTGKLKVAGKLAARLDFTVTMSEPEVSV